MCQTVLCNLGCVNNLESPVLSGVLATFCTGFLWHLIHTRSDTHAIPAKLGLWENGCRGVAELHHPVFEPPQCRSLTTDLERFSHIYGVKNQLLINCDQKFARKGFGLATVAASRRKQGTWRGVRYAGAVTDASEGIDIG